MPFCPVSVPKSYFLVHVLHSLSVKEWPRSSYLVVHVYRPSLGLSGRKTCFRKWPLEPLAWAALLWFYAWVIWGLIKTLLEELCIEQQWDLPPHTPAKEETVVPPQTNSAPWNNLQAGSIRCLQQCSTSQSSENVLWTALWISSFRVHWGRAVSTTRCFVFTTQLLI